MSQFKMLFVLCVSLAVSSAFAAEGTTKGVTFSGNAEGGYAYTWENNGGATTNASQFLLDNATVRMDANISDSTKFVFTNAFAVLPAAGVQPSLQAYFNSANFFDPATTIAGGTNNRFQFSNLAAYVDHKFADGVHVAFGNMENPFGMENMVGRWDIPTYYYSNTYALTNTYGWNYDVGAKVTLTDIIPGKFEFSVVDGRQLANTPWSPSLVARYSFEYKTGDMTITPEVSAYVGKFSGGPDDLGLSAGVWMKMSSYWVNAEFKYTAFGTNPNGTNDQQKQWEVWLEPGIDLGGIATLSIKGELINTDPVGDPGATTDLNAGVAIGHEYNNEYRIQLAYMHEGFLNKQFGPTNDLRLMVGTKF